MGSIVLDALKTAVTKVGTAALTTVAQTLSGAVNEINAKIPSNASNSNKCVTNSQVNARFTLTERTEALYSVQYPQSISTKDVYVDCILPQAVNLYGVPRAWISFEFIISNLNVHGEVISMTYSPEDGLTRFFIVFHNTSGTSETFTWSVKAKIADLAGTHS